MFSSLKSWCTVPVKRVNCVGYKPNAEPDMDYAEVIYAYVTGENVNIIDNEGHEVLSSTQLYLDPSIKVTNSDMIILADDTAYSIKKIKDFYDGNTGLLDLRVVYL